MGESVGDTGVDYARHVADVSYEWYQRHAIQTRRWYRTVEVLFVVLAAGIPVSAAILRDSTAVPAVLGAILVILTGLRNVYHWQENYVRFSRAREAVNAEVRAYLTSLEPYDIPGRRDQLLVAAITRIEQQEMGQWIRVISQHSRSDKHEEG